MKRTRRVALASMLLIVAGCSDDTTGPGTCTYGGKVYKAGESFPLGDGCNQCQCDEARLIVSCTARGCPKDLGAGEARRSDSRVADAARRDAARPDAAGCPSALKPVARICVRGEATPTGQETLGPGAIRVQSYPKGCFSSSCTSKVQTTCAVSGAAGSPLTVASSFCLVNTSSPGTGCTADCNGGGWAECSTPTLAAGAHTISEGSITVSFTIPSTVQAGGVCAGSQF